MYAEDPSRLARPKGCLHKTWLRQMDGHFWRVGLDHVSVWAVVDQDPKKFCHMSQHRVHLMKKWKKKKKVKDLVRLLVGFTDKKMEAYVRSQVNYIQPQGHVARFPEWNPAQRTRPKGRPRNTWLRQMDGLFHWVGLDHVLLAGRDPKKFCRMMKKRKKKIKVMDSIKRMKSYDVYSQGLSKDTDVLVYDCYKLRNVHSIKDFTIEGILQQEGFVIFTFEDMNLVAYVCNMSNWKFEKNFALLQMNQQEQCAKILPSAILSKHGSPSKMGVIHIICHPVRGGVDRNFIFEERKCLVIYPNYPQLMNGELRYIPHLFNRPLASQIFEEICQFINRAFLSAGILYYESHGDIHRVAEYNILQSLFLENWQVSPHHAAVCFIYVKNHSTATGFLLFDRYILTNAHVINDNIDKGVLNREVFAIFTYEDMKGGTYFLPLKVKPEVPAHCFNSQQIGMDFAVLELDLQEYEAQILPPALLSTYGPPSGMRNIYIIGHPGGGGKTSELCPITQDPICLEGRIFRYKTNFTEGSSGSPIFGENLQLLGIHTGGDKLSNGSANGFGISMKIILENLLLLMIQQNKREPLLKFILAATKGEHTIGVISEFIWKVFRRQGFEGVLSNVITAAKMCSEVQKLSTLLYNMGQTDSERQMISQHFLSPSQIPREDEDVMEVDYKPETPNQNYCHVPRPFQ
ncbi:uncharacterized protein LOC125705427 isoform X2 [Brienomyrus brachyistius]|uniref:uncharacterized protein LOC125705427 isoform X2 n=1 Tax=Brienomyrus brachyistius TaxID=42636 RepID=UPI0020B373CB|nr:uncharacterized protein LOC125705427 isoform X2 [Brienomyrus brachyistius]